MKAMTAFWSGIAVGTAVCAARHAPLLFPKSKYTQRAATWGGAAFRCIQVFDVAAAVVAVTGVLTGLFDLWHPCLMMSAGLSLPNMITITRTPESFPPE